MYEASTSFMDALLVIMVVCAAGYYLYRKWFRKRGQCGGCSGCPSSKKEQCEK
ncbi:FeoB-associated Cys-rich membrane protein [Vibrio tapetis]|uniref:FeoB-associated Cys-rich membrane protein n=1 Tax=Vibrio tapetis TaxID=52443 RepID=UPI0018D58A27|nr:FeoB-associated Cys-rich membrane protein [Vibrio tapetis]